METSQVPGQINRDRRRFLVSAGTVDWFQPGVPQVRRAT
jgi:hypothetical protein